jgi:hypothetical protein
MLPVKTQEGAWRVRWGAQKTGEDFTRTFDGAGAESKAKRHVQDMLALGYAVRGYDLNDRVFHSTGALPGDEPAGTDAFVVVTAGSGIRRTEREWIMYASGRRTFTPIYRTRAAADEVRKKLPSPDLWRVETVDPKSLPADAPAKWSY